MIVQYIMHSVPLITFKKVIYLMEANWKIMLFAVGAHVFIFGGILNFWD